MYAQDVWTTLPPVGKHRKEQHNVEWMKAEKCLIIHIVFNEPITVFLASAVSVECCIFLMSKNFLGWFCGDSVGLKSMGKIHLRGIRHGTNWTVEWRRHLTASIKRKCCYLCKSQICWVFFHTVISFDWRFFSINKVWLPWEITHRTYCSCRVVIDTPLTQMTSSWIIHAGIGHQ